MPIIITRDDPRYASLQKGHNARFPESEADAAKRIFLCENSADAADALQQIVGTGLRPTVRSGGHCYEDFVANNPGGTFWTSAFSPASTTAEVRRPIELVPEYSSGTDTWSYTSVTV